MVKDLKLNIDNKDNKNYYLTLTKLSISYSTKIKYSKHTQICFDRGSVLENVALLTCLNCT
jgi:hypothetical protein